MNKASLLLAGLAFAASGAPVLAMEYEVGPIYSHDHLACLDLARQEGNLIIEISALHPVVKHNSESEAAAHVKELKLQKLELLRAQRRVRCL